MKDIYQYLIRMVQQCPGCVEVFLKYAKELSDEQVKDIKERIERRRKELEEEVWI